MKKINVRFLYDTKSKKIYSDIKSKFKSHTELAYYYGIDEDSCLRFLFTHPSDFIEPLLGIVGLSTSSIDDYYNDTEDTSLFALSNLDLSIIEKYCFELTNL